MEKEFFDVFPSLKLKDQLKEWLEMVTVSSQSKHDLADRNKFMLHN